MRGCAEPSLTGSTPVPKYWEVCRAAMPSVAPSMETSMCVPWPSACTRRRAAAMAKAAYRPAVKS
ncbi:hypothetical protein ABC06_16840 [Bordetella pertussis]|nr:hypothetical protein RD13_16840 [Bordetella pertussis]AMT39434.1 hypothetical protein QR54_16840 [Bordetella pertussis]AMT53841.1 hypothetical protein QR58_16835 [Bordetella pertussis]ANS98607.1 hypothetical protein A8B96_17650 [Bordetella pertussis]ANT05681.1 hypothetical protein A8B93_16860 [Bordetella pertussis]